MSTPPPRIACLGEVLLRLSAPARQLLSQADSLELHIGGAEANVAVALARAGHAVHMLTLLADNELGLRCRDELRRHGVNTAGCRLLPGRMGLYFLTPGVALRPSQVIYDRAGSVFAEQACSEFAQADVLDGVDWLHVSGVTAALSAQHARLVPELLQRARQRNLLTSFDCNFRAKLWQQWPSDPAACFRHCAQHATVLFADARSLGLILGHDNASQIDGAAFGELSAQALEHFTQLEYIACTHRIELSATHHRLGARLRSRTGLLELAPIDIQPIVDRIGTGDAFAAGLLHGLLTQKPLPAALQFARSAALLKHTIVGDFNLAAVQDIEQLCQSNSLSVQR